jgi:hypothetical protein
MTSHRLREEPDNAVTNTITLETHPYLAIAVSFGIQILSSLPGRDKSSI